MSRRYPGGGRVSRGGADRRRQLRPPPPASPSPTAPWHGLDAPPAAPSLRRRRRTAAPAPAGARLAPGAGAGWLQVEGGGGGRTVVMGPPRVRGDWGSLDGGVSGTRAPRLKGSRLRCPAAPARSQGGGWAFGNRVKSVLSSTHAPEPNVSTLLSPSRACCTGQKARRSSDLAHS